MHSYKIKLAHLDGVNIYSIYRFDTYENAKWYIDYLYRGEKNRALIFECDERPNVTVIDNKLKWRLHA